MYLHLLPAYWNNEKEETQKCDSVDISIAVATEKVLFYSPHSTEVIISVPSEPEMVFAIPGPHDPNNKKC